MKAPCGGTPHFLGPRALPAPMPRRPSRPSPVIGVSAGSDRQRAATRVCRSDAASPWAPEDHKRGLGLLFARRAAVGLASAIVTILPAGDAFAAGAREVLPNAREMDAIMTLYTDETGKVDTRSDMYTPDAWKGIKKLREYATYIESVQPVENSEACENISPTCKENRLTLEKAFQVVSNEFYDQRGEFTQLWWADTLLNTIRDAGGVLPSQSATWEAGQRMIGALNDPYSEFLVPDDFQLALRRPSPLQQKYLAAQYTGIGVEVVKDAASGEMTVVSPFAASPAEEAGIRPGESLVEIDGYKANRLTLTEATGLMRGPPGTPVALKVRGLSSDWSTPSDGVREMVIERRRLPQPPIKQARLDLGGEAGQVGYIRIHYFSSASTRAIKEAVAEFEGEGGGVQGYILDLRNNPGGVFEEAIATAASLVECEDCELVETLHDDGFPFRWIKGQLPKEVYGDITAEPITRKPMVVLANRGSASASEVLTGALRDQGRLLAVLGETTFGKGVVQYYFPTGDGSGVKLTVMKYVTPSGTDITREGGLRPDEVCRDFPRGLSRYPDRCVRRAMDVLSGRAGVVPRDWRALAPEGEEDGSP